MSLITASGEDCSNSPKPVVLTAYLRELQYNNQCEFAFYLDLHNDDVGTIQEEIKAVRQITDNVESLLQHLINKICALIDTNLEKPKSVEENENDNRSNLYRPHFLLRIKPSGKAVKKEMVLQNLINTYANNTNGIEFIIFGIRYNVIFNAPLVKEIILPQIIFANHQIQPVKTLTIHNGKDSRLTNLYTWYKSKDRITWDILCEKFHYEVTEDDIGFYLKFVCVPINENGLRGPVFEVISAHVVEKMGDLPKCPFEERHKLFGSKEAKRIRFMSYNVLSSRYTYIDDKFSYCTNRCLSIDYRKQLITKEILGYKPDIICLQEVDSSAFVTHYRPTFNRAGYMAFYEKKGNRLSEGLACIFNKSRFRKVFSNQLVFSEEIQRNRLFLKEWMGIKSNEDVRECFVKQLSSLQVVILKDTSKGNLIIVANTHLFYKPDHEHIRVLQASMALTYIMSLKERYSMENPNVAVIFSGDFNSVPSACVLDFMTKGVNGIEAFRDKISPRVNLSHKFKFSSACGTPKYTNYTKDFKECLDYIFIEKEKLQVVNIAPFPSDEELARFEGLPNDVYPSDHLPLVADMVFV